MTTLNEALKVWASNNVANSINSFTEQHMYALNDVQADWLLPQYRQPPFNHATQDPCDPCVLYHPAVSNELYKIQRSDGSRAARDWKVLYSP